MNKIQVALAGAAFACMAVAIIAGALSGAPVGADTLKWISCVAAGGTGLAGLCMRPPWMMGTQSRPADGRVAPPEA